MIVVNHADHNASIEVGWMMLTVGHVNSGSTTIAQ